MIIELMSRIYDHEDEGRRMITTRPYQGRERRQAPQTRRKSPVPPERYHRPSPTETPVVLNSQLVWGMIILVLGMSILIFTPPGSMTPALFITAAVGMFLGMAVALFSNSNR